VAFSAFSQQTPHLAYIYPAGGRQGSTFQIVVGGQRLTGAVEAFVSCPDVQAKVIEFNRPMSQKEFNDLRDELRSLQEKRRLAYRRSQSNTNTWTAADQKQFDDIRNRILKNPPNRDANPALAEKVIVQITIPSNAPAGDHELRILTGTGLSNPLKFCIDQLPESTALAATAPNPELERFKRNLGVETNTTSPNAERRIALPAILNGQIMPGQKACFRFTAKKGQQLVAAAKARDLIPYLADAVPGWFQATLALYDVKGKELAYNDDFRFDPDPVLHAAIPADGEYILEIKDSIYRGREDFVYRITVGELPYITDVFPLGGHVGEKVNVRLNGWNLPTKLLSLQLPPIVTNLPITVQQNGYISNHRLFKVDLLPEIAAAKISNHIKLPVVINGQISKPGHEHVFRFEGRARQKIVAEVCARRLGSPLDSMLKLVDSKGKQLAFNDDYDDKSEGLETHHADSYLQLSLPKDDVYFLHLYDAEGRGGPEFGYRLRVSEPLPDFALRVTPSSLVSRAGLPVPVTVQVFRKDGFTNMIELRAEPASDFDVSGAVIQPVGDRLKITVLPKSKSDKAITLFGHAMLGDQEVVRAAFPADDMMQAFFYHHLAPAKELSLATLNKQWSTGSKLKILTKLPVTVPLGGTAPVKFAVPAALSRNRVQFELSDAPTGISLGENSFEGGTMEFALRCDAKKSKVGQKDNLIINVLSGRVQSDNKKQQNSGQRFVLGCLPAVPVEIVSRPVTASK
jgi:hypothetical protein